MSEISSVSPTSDPVDDGFVASEPFRVSLVIARSFHIYRRNFVPFSLLSALFLSVSYLYPFLQTAEWYVNHFIAYSVYNDLAVTILNLVLIFLIPAALTYGTYRDLSGNPASFSDAINRGLTLAFPVIGVSIVFSVAIAVGFLLLVVPGIYIAVIYFVAVPVAVVEKRGVWDSLGRSNHLTEGYKWQVLGILFLAVIVTDVPLYLVEKISEFRASSPEGLSSVAQSDLYFSLLYWLVQALGTAFSAVVMAVTYHDLRTTKEGGDAAQIAAVFD